jgi:pilus assembly protein Flp/PilA
MIEKIKKFLKDEEGASLVEYALLVALIAVVCILGVTYLGSTINTVLSNAGSHIAGS